MQGGSQVMWAKDRTYNKEGFIQEGVLGNVEPLLFTPSSYCFREYLLYG